VTIMKRKLMVILIAAGVLNACHYGTTVKTFPPAQGSKGAIADIATDRSFKAELIEVRDVGIVIQEDRKLRLLPYTSIVSFDVHGMKSPPGIGRRQMPSPGARDDLRLVSRFPQGLTPELLQKLLDVNGQTALAGENP